MLVEDRAHEMAAIVEKDKEKFKIELDEVRAILDQIQQSDSSNNSRFDQRTTESQSGQNSSAWSGSVSSMGSASSGMSAARGGLMMETQEPSAHLNLGRSIILSGIRENQWENLMLLILDLTREIGINMRPADIEKVFRIGEWDPRQPRPRPVKCVFYDEIKRDQVLYFKAGLRFSPIFKQIKINREEHKDLRVKSAMLRQAALLAREAGRFVYQRTDSVSIEGETYTLEQADNLPPEFRGPSNAMNGDEPLTPYLKARTRAENVTMIGTSMQRLSYGFGFFSAPCFMSNFYECEVVCRQISYRTLEHGYQARKAEICKNEQAYRDIMRSRFPADAKRIGGRVLETEEWRQIKLDIMEELLYCKFRQHKALYYQLLNTRPHDLFECTLCQYWGTGCKLGSIMLVERSWEGENHLGRLLMKVRDTFVKELVSGQGAIV